jgi:glycosyltransferase involved in cell wall biosynthesis
MPKVSIIIPTWNRPDLLPRAIKSVLSQVYQDFEIIIIDDGQKKSAENIVRQFNDSRIRYIRHQEEEGGAAARNTGIKTAKADFIAFLDDDDEWVPEKLDTQMKLFEKTKDDVGFCFSAVKNILPEGKEKISEVMEGVSDYSRISLTRFKGFLTSSLIVKKNVFSAVGMFDEYFPSHQEAELILRIAQKYKGLGINSPLVLMDMSGGHEQIGGKLERRIAGREMILSKHYKLFSKYPKILAKHYFWLGLWQRDNKEIKRARESFKKAWQTRFRLLYFFHYLFLLLFENEIN